jgi:hypothetical protein
MRLSSQKSFYKPLKNKEFMFIQEVTDYFKNYQFKLCALISIRIIYSPSESCEKVPLNLLIPVPENRCMFTRRQIFVCVFASRIRVS